MRNPHKRGNRWLPLQAALPRGTIAAVRYFDCNATTPLVPVAKEAWLRAQEEAWQNPSSPYRDAARVRVRLEGARHGVGTLTGAEPDRVVFVSGATEAANAIAAHLRSSLPADARVALNPTEHPSVLAAFAREFSGRLAFLPVSASGVIPPEELSARLARESGDTAIKVAVIMAANNETGVLLPWPEYARICREHGVSYVCDATQWIGKLPAAGLGQADWVFASAHKFGGTKGSGFLIRQADANGFKGQVGGDQQRGHRGGTEDFPAVAAMLAAWAEAERTKVLYESERQAWRQEFENSLKERLPGTRVVGEETDRLWNTVALLMPRHDNSRWVTVLDRKGFAVSTGSACAAGNDHPSHVLAALRVSPESIRRSIRISSGWGTTRDDWRVLAATLVDVAGELDRTEVVTVTP